jgi:hypothetical protein
MIGQESILAMRRKGDKPDYVWITDFSDGFLDGFTVRVSGDEPELSDFRFLVGLVAIVEGPDAARVARIAYACRVHAQRVIASVIEPVNKWQTVTSIEDTDGVMNWPT